MNNFIKALLVTATLTAIIYGCFVLITTIQYSGYDEFCEERNLSFDGNYGEPICYKIDNGKATYIFISKLNGEIYER